MPENKNNAMEQFPGLRDVSLYENPADEGRRYRVSYYPMPVSDGSLGRGPTIHTAMFATDLERGYYLRAEDFRVRLTQALTDTEYWEKTAKAALTRLSRKRKKAA